MTAYGTVVQTINTDKNLHCWLSADVIQTEAVTLEMSGVGNICQWKGYKKNKSICYMVETAHSISVCHKFLMNAYEVELICL